MVVAGASVVVAGVSTTCEDCAGRRFQPSVLEYRLGGRNIAEVFDMPVDEAVKYFAEKGIKLN